MIAVGRRRISADLSDFGAAPPASDHHGPDEHPSIAVARRAMAVLQRVTAAERRLSASISVNKITMLAAADELDAATRDARMWMEANPCPDARARGARCGDAEHMHRGRARCAAGRERSLRRRPRGHGPTPRPPGGHRLPFGDLDRLVAVRGGPIPPAAPGMFHAGRRRRPASGHGLCTRVRNFCEGFVRLWSKRLLGVSAATDRLVLGWGLERGSRAPAPPYQSLP